MQNNNRYRVHAEKSQYDFRKTVFVLRDGYLHAGPWILTPVAFVAFITQILWDRSYKVNCISALKRPNSPQNFTRT
jgi:hypothetical protein